MWPNGLTVKGNLSDGKEKRTQSGLQILAFFWTSRTFPTQVDCAQEKRIERFIEFLPERDSWFAPFLNVLLVQFFGSLEGLAGPTCYVWIRSGILRDRD